MIILNALLIPANSTIAKPKPIADAAELTIVSINPKSSLIFKIDTPNTAQLVVISGKYIPNDV